MFDPVDPKLDFPAAEARILQFWKEREVFRKSLAQRAGAPRFVFYEGPPTANGRPHPGHVLTRVVKDLYPRYKTMCGCLVPRKAGWDTHGLPVEVEVEKELGIEGKPGIEKYGVEPFVHKCIESVFRYTADWERLTERIGFWLDLSDAYVTYHESYVESVWWALQQIHRQGLLVRGHKSVPWCPRCSTALSSHEVGWGYKEVTEESVFVGFRSKADPKTYFLAWTTTPWTLPSNAALAVKADAAYARVKVGDEFLILARDLVPQALGKIPHEVVGTMPGADLVGQSYEPLFPYGDPAGKRAFVVLAADFVSVAVDPKGESANTGIVHVAPGFGEDDYRLGRAEGLPVIQLVDPFGRFTPPTPWAGRFIKDVDAEIVKDLAQRKLLLRSQQVTHQYPFCWRCDAPLFYYARAGWFVRTTAIIDRIIANNRKVNWLPEHIREGRYGEFLATNVDWALSRERYWGTPLPVWVCEGCGAETVPASTAEVLAANPHAFDDFAAARERDPGLNRHLRVHKPWIDRVTLPCAKCGGTMRRVPEVIDCWFDAGAMPFAQFGYPRQGKDEFAKAFPADFIAEAIDQTRGWFYSLMAISTIVFPEAAHPHPFKTCIVFGHVCDAHGKKMSKSLGNYVPPDQVLDTAGADALRWYFYSANLPWTSVRFDQAAVVNAHKEFVVRLRNVYSFFVIYANIDGFDPRRTPAPRLKDRPLLDRWITSELHCTIEDVREALDAFNHYGAAGRLLALVDGLSNWYLRRSRDRFWKAEKDADKWAAYWTLYDVLVATAKLIAPFVPFFAEEMYQNLVRRADQGAPESVHLADYPKADPAAVDEVLGQQMDLVREVVALGRSARTAAKLRVRQPLAEAIVILSDRRRRSELAALQHLVLDELNVKALEFADLADEYVTHEVKPNFKRLGPKYGQKVQALAKALAAADPGAVTHALESEGRFKLLVEGEVLTLDRGDVVVRLETRPHYAAAEGPAAAVVLTTDLTPDLIAEGLAREVVHHIQGLRGDLKLDYQARIRTTVAAPDSIRQACERFSEYLRRETLTSGLVFGAPTGTAVTVKIDQADVTIGIESV
jgi:isoleucyl-tRNA synthetase